MKSDNVAVLNTGSKAELLAEKLALLLTEVEDYSNYSLILKYSENGLCLCDGKMSLYGDFKNIGRRLKNSNLKNEALIKAAKIKGCCDYGVFDATAGLGEDSFLLAAAGFSVEMYERNPIIASLLENAMFRAENEGYANIISHMNLTCADSITALKNLEKSPDIIYLDPMFPQRQKSSLIKKKFQILQQLEAPCENDRELLQTAIKANPIKIIIKRPAKAEFLAGEKPSYSINGSTIRYDCIVLK